jgi:hypothetical protein
MVKSIIGFHYYVDRNRMMVVLSSDPKNIRIHGFKKKKYCGKQPLEIIRIRHIALDSVAYRSDWEDIKPDSNKF